MQGPGRASGNGKIIIAYLNGKLPAFVDVPVSVVDVADVAEAHLLARRARRGRARATCSTARRIPSREALELVSELSGVRERVRHRAAGARARRRRSPPRRPAGCAGSTSSLCRARVRTILHGHRYDGSLRERELGLDYTPVADTFARTIDWAVAEGLVTRPLPARR